MAIYRVASYICTYHGAALPRFAIIEPQLLLVVPVMTVILLRYVRMQVCAML